MAEDRVEPREGSLSQRLPWINIFQGFRIALDFNKLVLAAAGILVMALGWWLLAVIFNSPEPKLNRLEASRRFNSVPEGPDRDRAIWTDFRDDHYRWAVRYRAAGSPDEGKVLGAADFADSLSEYDRLEPYEKTPATPEQLAKLRESGNPSAFVEKVEKVSADIPRPAGKLRVAPWSEDRGPNPYLVVTGQNTSWRAAGFVNWVVNDQAPVLLEPLFKMVRPVVYFFQPNIGVINGLYFLMVLFWTVITWAIFGGAITRIAAVQVARREKITLGEAVRFTVRRWLSFVTAPLFPLAFVGFLLVFMVLFGFFHMIPIFGDILVSGFLWWLLIVLGLLMAIGLVGLVGWPLMSATISTEGTDSWEAVSRSYSYVFQAPWYYLWNGVVALAYGAIVVFFVGFMGSFAVYLGKWGVSQTPFISKTNREPSYLFVYTPESFGWRSLLLQGAVVDGTPLVNPETGRINDVAYRKYLRNYEYDNGTTYDKADSLSWWNKVGAFLVGIWVGVFFLLILGFGYSFFWSASTIIYLLMRKKVDDAELDEVYLEEDDADAYQGPLTPAPTPATPAGGKPLTMVEPPTLRPPPPAATPAPTPPPPEIAHAPTAVTPAPEPPPIIPPPPEPEPEPEPAANPPTAQATEPASEEPAPDEEPKSEPS